MGILLLLCLGAAPQSGPADWPMWRHDAGHTASTPHALPGALTLQWVRELPPLKPGWPDQPRMQLDAEYEPVVLGRTMFVPSSRTDSLTAYDTRSGLEKWRFFTDGPVRYPAAAWEGQVFFASDDGHLYCLDAETGALRWKFFGGPRDRRILGNERLISTWPARGAPVIADGTVYFAAGIWPFMGTFLYALDARTGKVVWQNEADGSTYMQQPHNTDAFAGVAPQGPLTVSGDRLLIPGGRSVPACYDRTTGKIKYFEFAKNARRGGVDVAAAGSYFYAGGSAYDLATGAWAGDVGRAIVAAPETIWYGGKTRDLLLAKPPIATTVETLDRKGNKSVKPMWKLSPARTVEAPKIECLIRAGGRIYAGAEGRVLAYENEKEVWRGEVRGTPASLIAADDRLFVVTREGSIACFGAEKGAGSILRWKPTEGSRGGTVTLGTNEGYAILFGASDPAYLRALLECTDLRIVAFDPEASRVDAARRELTAAGLYGDRLALHAGDPRSVPLPPYVAGVISVAEPPATGDLARLYASLRPYGGRLLLPLPADRRAEVERAVASEGLVGAEIEEVGGRLAVVRAGALPGSGNWTHEHADAANTRVSKDRVVRSPLGVLWFGGPSHEGILPRHGHGPQPQVIDGRLLIEGVDMLRAMDIYTGRVLWEAKLPGLGDYFNNVLHQPGANASGTNFISTSDAIYVAYKNRCLRLDPATGKTLSEIAMPPGKPSPWGYLNVVGDYLVGGTDPIMDVVVERAKEGGLDDPLAPQDLLIKKLLTFKGDNDTLSASRRLFVLDRHTGKLLWEKPARAAFRHNGTCAGGGRLYAIDRLSGAQVDRMKKKGETSNVAPRLIAFDLKDGREAWSTEEEVFGTWLSYSEGRDILVEAGRVARDTLKDEAKGMKARRGADGSVLWNKKLLGPAMIHGDTILMADRACDLRTGDPKGRLHPWTQQPMEWSYARTYGCNTPMASEHLMTFRSGAAGFFDLAGDGGTGNFGGFRSSCTNNLICAGGILNAPDYTRTCLCSYQNQASLALVPMPEAEAWTFFGVTDVKAPVRRIGVNLGAPGDRRAEDGTLWAEFPGVGGKSPSAPVSLNPDKPAFFRKNALRISGEGLAWVAASGAKGLKEVTVALDKDAKEERLHTVRLHFVEPDGLGPGERVFDVSLQGKPVLKDFDVSKEAGGADRSLVREFREVAARKELKIAFAARVGVPVLCGIEIVPSCRIPLFRFALERWPADPYTIVLHGGAPAVEAAGANVRVDRVAGGTSPRVEVAYPREGALLASGIPPGLFNSPARRELLHRLLSGTSAVWVLVESGEKAKDDAAAALLEATLKDLEGSLRLPELRQVPEDELANKSVPLTLDFSLLRLSRSDAAEEMFVRMLLRSAPGLEAKRGPLAFAVFGRGRSLPGSEVSVEAVTQAAERLVAPCTNEARGPGFDLLMTADWTGLVGEVPGKVTEVPPGEALLTPRPEEEYATAAAEIDPSSPRFQLTWLIAAGTGMLLLLLLLRRRMP